jgi:hypothetical protein
MFRPHGTTVVMNDTLGLRLLATLHTLARQSRPATPSALQELLGTEPTALRSTLRALVREGYVTLKPVERDPAAAGGLAFPVLPQLTWLGFALGAAAAREERPTASAPQSHAA